MKILIVDNDKNIAETIKVVIATKTQYEAQVAYSGKEGLEKMNQAGDFDLLILDIMMEGLSGIDVCKIMMADARLKSMPILLMSALPVASAEFAQSMKEFDELKNVTNVLEKPFTITDLLAKINACLGPKATPPAAA